MDKRKCDLCSAWVDFDKDPNVFCRTHLKDLCWNCGCTKDCDAKEKCDRGYFPNPAWEINLKVKDE